MGYAPEVEVPDGIEDEVLLEDDPLLEDVALPDAPVGVGVLGTPLEGPVGVGVPGTLGLLGVAGVLGVLGALDPSELLAELLAELLGAALPSCAPCAASCCFTIATKSALWLSGIGFTATAVPQSL